MNVMLMNILKISLDLPKRYIILLDFMLCPIVAGNYKLEDEYAKLGDTFWWRQKEAVAEKE